MTSVDSVVGSRIRARRLEIGMTQTQLATLICVRFQQVQKYENGQNRVAASRLWQIATALQVPVCYFFEDLLEDPRKEQRIGTRRNRELVELFESLNSPQKSAVMSFLRSVSG